MQPVALILSLGTLWALLHWWLLPLVKQRWQAADLRVKMARAGVLVAAEKLRDLAAVGTIAMGLVLLVVLLSNWLGGADVLWPKALIEAAASVYQTAKSLADGYGSALGLFGVLVGAFVLWRASKAATQRVAEVWMQAANAEHAAIRADPSRIDRARADAELLPVVQQIDAAIQALQEQDRAEPANPAARERAQHALGQALSQLALESARKSVDFAAAAGHATADEQRQPRKPWQRVLDAVSSKRFSEDLGLVKKPVGYVVTGLLFVSLLGWSAEPLANSLQLAVNNLRAHALEQQAQRELDQALSRAPEPSAASATPPPAQADAVATATRLATRAIVQHMARQPVLDMSGGVRRGAQAEAEFVRAALTEHSLPAGAGGDDAVAHLRAEVAKSVAATPDPNTATARHVSRELEPTLKRLHDQHPERLASLIERLEARYAGPMSPVDAQGKLMAKLLDETFGALDAKPDGELGKQAQKLAKDFGKESVKTWANSALKQFLADTLAGVARPEVQRAFAFESSQASRDFIASLQSHEGQGWRAAATAGREARMAGQVAEKVAQLHTGANAAQQAALSERLAGYERLFPSDLGAQPPVSGVPGGGGGGGGGGGNRPHASAAPHAPQARSTSFHLASRSFRVRGVLVGQDLGGAALDVTDLRWQLTAPSAIGAATRIQLQLRLADSPRALPIWRDAGSFDAGVLNQALRYAADRRVIATTITGGDGRAIRRLTYLHPVLADTPLGCRVVESDRLVDTFTQLRDGGSQSVALNELAADREQMFRWLGALGLAEAVAASPGACPRPQVQRGVEARKLAQVSFSPAMRQGLNKFIAERAASAPGSEQLLRTADACAAAPIDGLAQCLCDQVAPAGLPPRYWFPEDHTSQVRERAAPLSTDLGWLRPSADRLQHLDFWTHTTFAIRDGRSGDSDESATAALDFPPAQLAALRRQVAERLPGYLARQLRSPSYDDFMRPLEEFVLAQRLARAALDGRLGRDFPLARLLALEKDTRAFVPRQTTVRWEAVGAPRDLYQTLAAADVQAGEQFKAHQLEQASRMLAGKPLCDRASN